MALDQSYKKYKTMLFGLAYRILGIAADAEDIVQDVFAQFMQVDESRIANVKAFLTKMTVNRCINLLNSASRRREIYTGPWLPEPLPTGLNTGIGSLDPVERRETVGYAYLVLMQQLTPIERSIYILKETFGFKYRDIAEMLGKTETSCRKTFSRANQKVGHAQVEDQQPSEAQKKAQEQFVEAFLCASDTGNFKPLLSFLTDEVTLVTDGGGKVRAALNPILGIARVQAFLEGLAAKGSVWEGFVPARLNGEPGLLQKRDGRVVMAVTADWELNGSRIRHLYFILNPDKLTHFN